MSKFILKKGDYLNLSSMSVDKKKDIYDWLVEQGNEFSNSFSSLGECIEVYTAIGNRHSRLIQCSLAESLYACSTNNRTKELLEAMENETKLPEEFIIVNANNMAVRQWLKDLGYKWGWKDCGLDLTENHRSDPVARVDGYRVIRASMGYCNEAYPHLPIITPRIDVTGFDIETPNDNQEEIERMKKNIEELKESIKKLEGK